jgi:hypothetical protein
MENSNDVKHLAYFPRQWLAKVLTQCRAVGGIMSLLRWNGGLNSRYTKSDGSQKLDLEKFIRIMVNKAILQSYQGFMDDWMALGQKLYKFGNNHGDEFNKLYKRKKQYNEKNQLAYGKEKEDDSHH